jgi:hypothetical protein
MYRVSTNELQHSITNLTTSCFSGNSFLYHIFAAADSATGTVQWRLLHKLARPRHRHGTPRTRLRKQRPRPFLATRSYACSTTRTVSLEKTLSSLIYGGLTMRYLLLIYYSYGVLLTFGLSYSTKLLQGGTIRGSINLPAQSLWPTIPTIYAMFTAAGMRKVIWYCGRSSCFRMQSILL